MNGSLLVNNLKRVWFLLPNIFRRKAYLILFLMLFNSLLELFGLASLIPLIVIVIEENAIANSEMLSTIFNELGFTNENSFIVFTCIIIILAIIGKNIISLFISRYQANYSFNIYRYFANKLLSFYYEKGFLFFKQTNSHLILRNISAVPSNFAQNIVLNLIQLFTEFVILGFIVIGILLYDAMIILYLAAIVGPVFFVFYRSAKNRIKRIKEELYELTPVLNKNIFESIHGYVDVKILNKEKYFHRVIDKSFDKLTKLQVKSFVFNLLPTKVNEVSMMLGILIIVIYGVYALDDRSELITLLGVFGLAAYRVLPSINRTMLALFNLQAFQYTFDVIEEVKEYESSVKKEGLKLAFNHSIELNNVSFSYPDKEEKALDSISVSIDKGKKIGVVGRSGSGKTTLINLLLRFVKEQSGEVKLDGKQLSDDDAAAWRKLVGYVQQEVYLIDGTLVENIAFGEESDEIDHDRLKSALEKASLLEFVNDLDNGIHTHVGEQGAQISGGQKQRIGIARALYSGAEILIFDEATSALDSETEKEITESIERLSGYDLTMIIIAHRVTTLKYCDRILVIKDGRVEKETNYSEIIDEELLG